MRALVIPTDEPSVLQSQADDSMWMVRTNGGTVLAVVILFM